jgi:solute carrier family 27 (fatty acid transporter), member 1/4
LPKPAVIKQSRYYGGGFTFFDGAKLTPEDIIFVTLPIYHGNGGLIGIGATLISGATVVLRKKFSASNFWSECIHYNCTAFIYVGEICRFLINQPPSEFDRKHRIRKAIGNGLRKNVWIEFYNRFGIDCVEIYGSTEGNCTMSK